MSEILKIMILKLNEPKIGVEIVTVKSKDPYFTWFHRNWELTQMA